MQEEGAHRQSLNWDHLAYCTTRITKSSSIRIKVLTHLWVFVHTTFLSAFFLASIGAILFAAKAIVVKFSYQTANQKIGKEKIMRKVSTTSAVAPAW